MKKTISMITILALLMATSANPARRTNIPTQPSITGKRTKSKRTKTPIVPAPSKKDTTPIVTPEPAQPEISAPTQQPQAPYVAPPIAQETPKPQQPAVAVPLPKEPLPTMSKRQKLICLLPNNTCTPAQQKVAKEWAKGVDPRMIKIGLAGLGLVAGGAIIGGTYAATRKKEKPNIWDDFKKDTETSLDLMPAPEPVSDVKSWDVDKKGRLTKPDKKSGLMMHFDERPGINQWVLEPPKPLVVPQLPTQSKER